MKSFLEYASVTFVLLSCFAMPINQHTAIYLLVGAVYLRVISKRAE
jgi:hypothetical protein